MTTQTFIFVSDDSDSDDLNADDKTSLIPNNIQGQRKKDPTYKREVTEHDESNYTKHLQKLTPNGNHALSNGKRKSKTNKKVKVKSVEDGLKQLEQHELAKQRRKILYQLMVTSAIAMLHGLSLFPAFWNSVLLNIDDLTTQTACLWTLFVCFILSGFMTPSVISRFSFKCILHSGCISAIAFSLARFYPKLYTVIPASVILGLTMAPFYVSIFKHVSNLSRQYEGYQGTSYKDTVLTFTAVTYGWISCSPLWLSILHCVIYNLIGEENAFAPLTSPDCGFSYLWQWSEAGSSVSLDGLSPEIHHIQALLGSCLVCTAGAILVITVALDNYKVPERQPSELTPSGDRFKDQAVRNVGLLRDSNHLLMFPVFFGVAAVEIYCYTLFGQAFVSCYYGSDSLYYTMLSTSLAGCITAVPATAIYKRLSSVKVTVPIYIFTLVLLLVVNFGTYIPYPVFFVLTSMLGFVNFVLLSQVTAMVLYQCESKVEVSLSLYHFTRGLVFLLAFIMVRYQGDNSTLTVAILGAVAIGFFCHILLEVRLKLLEKQDTRGGCGKSGAYVLLGQSPLLPEVDPTTVKQDRTMSLLTRLPGQEEEEQCNQQ